MMAQILISLTLWVSLLQLLVLVIWIENHL